MNWLKAVAAGLIAGVIMFIVLMVGTNQGFAPFKAFRLSVMICTIATRKPICPTCGFPPRVYQWQRLH